MISSRSCLHGFAVKQCCPIPRQNRGFYLASAIFGGAQPMGLRLVLLSATLQRFCPDFAEAQFVGRTKNRLQLHFQAAVGTQGTKETACDNVGGG